MSDKPIDKVINDVNNIKDILEDIKKITEDFKSIKNDVAIIKSRIHEINRARIEREQQEAENVSKGWGVGWW